MTSLSVERGSSDRSPETIPASDCGQCAIATNPGWTLVTFYPAAVGVQTKMPHFVEAPIACRTEYSQSLHHFLGDAISSTGHVRRLRRCRILYTRLKIPEDT